MAKRRLTNCTNGGPISVHVEDDKVTRVEPLVIDDADYKSWVISTAVLAAPSMGELMRLAVILNAPV